MIPSNPIDPMIEYANDSQYTTPPSTENLNKGTVPLDTLPADWWNWLWKQITMRINESSVGVGSILAELRSVLDAASIEPSELYTDQLLKAIRAIVSRPGTAGTAGAVKSSSTSGYIAIDADGYMSPNGMGIPANLNTSSKVIVGAINELLETIRSNDTYARDNIAALAATKAPNNHASTTVDYGVGNSTHYGHLRLIDSTTSAMTESSGMAVAPNAVRRLQEQVNAIESSSVMPTGSITMFAGESVPSGWLLCNGAPVGRSVYPALFSVIGTTYGEGDGSTSFNLPDFREASPVGVGERASGVTGHNKVALGEFQDDQFAAHYHGANIAGHTHNYTPQGKVTSTFTGAYTSVIVYGGNHTHDIPMGNVSETDEYGRHSIDPNRYNASWYHSTTFSGSLTMSGSITPQGSVTSTFTGTTAGTTSSQSIVSIGASGASSGGTHGKLLGINFIIKS